MGTGSYVDESLHWYRSTLAHNAPLVDGRSQMRVDGFLDTYEVDDHAGRVSAEAEIAPGVVVRRSLRVTDDVLLDEVVWEGDRSVRFELPLHVDLAVLDEGVTFVSAPLNGESGTEDGFTFVSDSEYASLAPNSIYRCRGSDGATYATVELSVFVDQPTQLWRSRAPGAPGQGPRRFAVLRSTGTSGRFRMAWAWRGTSDAWFATKEVDSARDVIPSEVPSLGHIVIPSKARSAQSRDLQGPLAPERLAERPQAPEDPSTTRLRRHAPDDKGGENLRRSVQDDTTIVLRRGKQIALALGERHYRRSEDDWASASAPTAAGWLRWDGESLSLHLRVERVDRTFPSADAINALDNESPDINGAGIQLYVVAGEGRALGTMLIPDPESSQVRLRRIDGWVDPLGTLGIVDATWSRTADGYALEARVMGLGARPGNQQIGFDVIINEKPIGRERRRGQLVLSGGAGEHVYLRGDRHDPTRLIPMLLTDD